MKTWLLAAALAATTLPALAQHQASHAGRSPYAGMQSRAVKALSDVQLADLRAGRGMTLALPAELNGYPGPSHALELAAPLGLSDTQTRATRALFEQMKAEATRAGEDVIAGETALDRLFRDGVASAASVQAATAETARAQGALRAVHLRYHLLLREVLTPEQSARYSELRGYE